MEQIAIALTGCIAVLLSQTASPATRKWACIFGIVGQPFWFYATYKAAQWGMFGLCFLYTYAWALGVWNNWLKPRSAMFFAGRETRWAKEPNPPPTKSTAE